MTKQRITVSVSRKAAEFLRSEQMRRCLPSVSILIEQIAADLQNKAERQIYKQQMHDHYAALSNADVAEDRKWRRDEKGFGGFGRSIRFSS